MAKDRIIRFLMPWILLIQEKRYLGIWVLLIHILIWLFIFAWLEIDYHPGLYPMIDISFIEPDYIVMPIIVWIITRVLCLWYVSHLNIQRKTLKIVLSALLLSCIITIVFGHHRSSSIQNIKAIISAEEYTQKHYPKSEEWTNLKFSLNWWGEWWGSEDFERMATWHMCIINNEWRCNKSIYETYIGMKRTLIGYRPSVIEYYDYLSEPLIITFANESKNGDSLRQEYYKNQINHISRIRNIWFRLLFLRNTKIIKLVTEKRKEANPWRTEDYDFIKAQQINNSVVHERIQKCGYDNLECSSQISKKERERSRQRTQEEWEYTIDWFLYKNLDETIGMIQAKATFSWWIMDIEQVIWYWDDWSEEIRIEDWIDPSNIIY